MSIKKIIHVDRNAFVWKGSKNCLTDRIQKKILDPDLCPKTTWKIAHSFGQGHIPSSQCTKHTMLGPLLEVREGAAPPPQTHCWRPWWWSLFWTCCCCCCCCCWCCCCCCCCCCCSWLLWILWMVLVLVLVLVVLVPWEEATFKKIKSWRGVGGEGAAPPPQMHRWRPWWWSLFRTCCCSRLWVFSGPASSRWNTITIAFVAGKEVFLLLL